MSLTVLSNHKEVENVLNPQSVENWEIHSNLNLPKLVSVLKAVLSFLGEQLDILHHSEAPEFEHAFHILEILYSMETTYISCLSSVQKNSFCKWMLQKCFSLANINGDGASKQLHRLLLKISQKLVTCMINEGSFSKECLHYILVALLEETEPDSSGSYNLAKELLFANRRYLETQIRNILVKRLHDGPSEGSTLVMDTKPFEVIYKVYHIDSMIMLGVINSLEYCLSSSDESERREVLEFLCCFFSEQHSSVASDYKKLWNAFLLKLRAEEMAGDVVCKHTYNFLVNHPELSSDYKRLLKKLIRTKRPSLRKELLFQITKAILHESSLILHDDQLLQLMAERIRTDFVDVRLCALRCLGLICREYPAAACPVLKERIIWLHNFLLEHYINSNSSNSDRATIKQLLFTAMVPKDVVNEEKIILLQKIWLKMSEKARKAFHEMGERDFRLRKWTLMMVEHIKTGDDKTEEITKCINRISGELLDGGKSEGCLRYLVDIIRKDKRCQELIEVILMPSSTQEELNSSKDSLRKRVSWCAKKNDIVCSVLNTLLVRLQTYFIDTASVNLLIKCIAEAVFSENGLDAEICSKIKDSLLFVQELVNSCPHTIFCQEALNSLMSVIYEQNGQFSENILLIFKTAAKFRPIGEVFHQLFEEKLLYHWRRFVLKGDLRQAKLALQCILKHAVVAEDNVPKLVLGDLKKQLRSTDRKKCVIAVKLSGHLTSLWCSEEASHLISLLKLPEVIRCQPEEDDFAEAWCERSALPFRTLAKIVAVKTLTLYHMSVASESVEEFLSLLCEVVDKHGNISEDICLSNAESSWLRLTAGCALLKMSTDPAVWKKVSILHMATISSLILDENENVCVQFVRKLCHHLTNENFPVDFFAFFSLVGMEKRQHLRDKFEDYFHDCVKAKWAEIGKICGKSIGNMENCPGIVNNIIPETSINAVIALLAYYPELKDVNEMVIKKEICACLKFFWGLMLLHKFSTVHPSVSSYKEFLDKIKRSVSSIDPDDEQATERLRVVALLAGATLQGACRQVHRSGTEKVIITPNTKYYLIR
ncbi:uncharacterized protein LOC126283006 isoform X2 [Schistocerca gregaria]|uniref:uncharacterized protein LOC126283006 isoform X2 n=1 Tax=Schistocerca gregaria TaxID=7010 RepID=UPI00211E93C6|nr:uncharacterized protein LOC126283006 isoform X2 [Schistocerca gregaria]XP_049838200.1 uncharacterized protein LOC126283006 isoform X2 [Schistocerca gregaria]XP_049838201.1 uncharacterized protein LOC126283006 isoform X2 [Schistocerca gregaria]